MYLDPDHPCLTDIALRKDLLALGHTDRSLARAVATGQLGKPRRGAYVDGALWAQLSREERYALRVRSALRQACVEAAATHVSALPFLDAPTWALSLEAVHTTRKDGRAGRREAGIKQHRGALEAGDLVVVGDIECAAPMRATLEVATMTGVEPALVVLNHFLHRGDFTAAEIRDRYENGMALWPDSLATDLVLRLGDPRIESAGESRTHYFLWRHHFPSPEPQFEVYDGPLLFAYLDFAFPDLGIWIEFDGKEKYLKFRRPGESVVDAVLREKQRESRVAELTGWRCIRITWADLADPVRLARRIRAVIEAAAAARR
ncbi:hypothetical protein [Nocardioides daeguensis]|uniref:Type IV toxin-antitoxin system AbiEi family antitoxin domain-containing protein n=1 Tax=Nocardioides daeguensis TaxID=908359 RepID=A0ABP6VZ56_9ACTN|nr:hypothetical protein [Nocardioides daeguensis]MBV6726850.1 hypothetical protein [Nocardioides daeguensis]MCR1774398.1 hypothetical protein [Nocardioides daeguensis]